MKVAVSAVDKNLDAQVDSHFGRAAFYLIVESESMTFEYIANPNVNARGGAGIQSAQLVIDKGVRSLLTGKCGPNAFEVLKTAGINIYENFQGTVREAIQAFQSDQVVPSYEPGGKPLKQQI